MNLNAKIEEILAHLRGLGFAAVVVEMSRKKIVDDGGPYEFVMVKLAEEKATGMASLTQKRITTSFSMWWNMQEDRITESGVTVQCFYEHQGGGTNGFLVSLK